MTAQIDTEHWRKKRIEQPHLQRDRERERGADKLYYSILITLDSILLIFPTGRAFTSIKLLMTLHDWPSNAMNIIWNK